MKLAVVGGGSTYTPELVDGIARLPGDVRVEELVLIDPDGGEVGAEVSPDDAQRWLERLRPHVAHLVLRPFLDAYSVVAEQLAAADTAEELDEQQFLAGCLRVNTGTLTVAGTSTIDGQPVVEVKGAGDSPGSAPDVLYVATTGTPYPLRWTTTGPTKPGGAVDACNKGRPLTATADLHFSDFNSVPPIKAPSGAIDIG